MIKLRQEEREETIAEIAYREQKKQEQAEVNLQEVLRKDYEYRKKLEELTYKKLDRTRKLAYSMSAPRSLADFASAPQNLTHQSTKVLGMLDESYMIKLEMKRLKEANVQQNLEREMKKLALKKVSILEKEYLFNQKIS